MSGALLRYRIFAYCVGVGLLVLTLIGVPLQYAANIPQVDAIVGPIHGCLYIVYLFFALDLARRARFTMWQLIAMVAAGFCPFVAFIMERKITRRVSRQIADEQSGDLSMAGS